MLIVFGNLTFSRAHAPLPDELGQHLYLWRLSPTEVLGPRGCSLTRSPQHESRGLQTRQSGSGVLTALDVGLSPNRVSHNRMETVTEKDLYLPELPVLSKCPSEEPHTTEVVQGAPQLIESDPRGDQAVPPSANVRGRAGLVEPRGLSSHLGGAGIYRAFQFSLKRPNFSPFSQLGGFVCNSLRN